jgi:hypothetical protein
MVVKGLAEMRISSPGSPSVGVGMKSRTSQLREGVVDAVSQVVPMRGRLPNRTAMRKTGKRIIRTR